MPKISLIGAGSVVFARRLFRDLVSTPGLGGATVSLMDVNPERMELITAFARRLVMDTGSNIKGNRVDIYFKTKKEAQEFGRQVIWIRVLDGGIELAEALSGLN